MLCKDQTEHKDKNNFRERILVSCQNKGSQIKLINLICEQMLVSMAVVCHVLLVFTAKLLVRNN